MNFAWELYEINDKNIVEDFIQINGGSFFHEPSFFDYHENNSFDSFDLICRKDNRIVAWLPGYKSKKIYISPRGASYGGLFFSRSNSLEHNLIIIESLKEYFKSKGFDKIFITTPPSIYFGDTNFALSANGFITTQRIACHILQLTGEKWPNSMSKSKRYDYRKALRHGLNPTELSGEHYSNFHKLLVKNCLRFNTIPTHSEVELLLLKKILPSRIRLFAAMDRNKMSSGILVFMINPKVAYTFYIVSSESDDKSGATLVALVHCIETLQKEGIHWLDLGPGTFKDFVVNKGVSKFKQLMGSKLFTRDTWSCAFKS